MLEGLLWFDKSDRPLAEKVKAAAQRHNERLGCVANTVYVNPADYNADAVVPGVIIRSSPYILKDHLWIGYEQS